MGPMNLKAVEMLVSDAIALSQRMTQNDPGRVVKNALNQNFISAFFPQREGRVKREMRLHELPIPDFQGPWISAQEAL